MRKLIAAAAVLAVTSAHAAEELKFGDLNYFLKQGQFNVLVDANSGFSKETGNTTYEKRGYTFDTQLAYAINDRLNAFVGLSYAWDMEVEDKTKDNTNADFSQDGLANPAIGLNYRLFDQGSSAYNFDLGAVARIAIEDAEVGSSIGQNSKDGNNASSRNALELNARMGRKWNEANEWQLAGGLVYFQDGEYTAKETTGDVKVDEDSSMDLFLRASYQYRPVNEFMVLVSAQATRVGEVDSKASGVKTTEDSHIDLDFRFTAKYLICENFIGKFNYGQARNSNYDSKTAGVKTEIDKRRESFYGLGVDFLF